jgi:hypothetical protein
MAGCEAASVRVGRGDLRRIRLESGPFFQEEDVTVGRDGIEKGHSRYLIGTLLSCYGTCIVTTKAENGRQIDGGRQCLVLHLPASASYSSNSSLSLLHRLACSLREGSVVWRCQHVASDSDTRNSRLAVRGTSSRTRAPTCMLHHDSVAEFVQWSCCCRAGVFFMGRHERL